MKFVAGFSISARVEVVFEANSEDEALAYARALQNVQCDASEIDYALYDTLVDLEQAE